MQVTFDKSARAFVYEAFASEYDMVCCSCKKEITAKNFGGAGHDGEKPVFTHKYLLCVMDFAWLIGKESND